MGKKSSKSSPRRDAKKREQKERHRMWAKFKRSYEDDSVLSTSEKAPAHLIPQLKADLAFAKSWFHSYNPAKVGYKHISESEVLNI